MSRKKSKKQVTVAGLTKNAGTKKKAATTKAAPETAKAAYHFVSTAKSKARDGGPRTLMDTLCRIPIVRTAQNVAQSARDLVETAKSLGVVARDRLLQTVLERFA